MAAVDAVMIASLCESKSNRWLMFNVSKTFIDTENSLRFFPKEIFQEQSGIQFIDLQVIYCVYTRRAIHDLSWNNENKYYHNIIINSSVRKYCIINLKNSILFLKTSRSKISKRSISRRFFYAKMRRCAWKSVFLLSRCRYLAFIPMPSRHSVARTRSFKEHSSSDDLRGHLKEWAIE